MSPPFDQLQVLRRDTKYAYRTPRWSNDGHRIAIAVQTGASGWIDILDAVNFKSEVVSTKFPYKEAGGYCSQLSIAGWSHSDRWLAIEYAFFGSFDPRLYLLDTKTGELTLISKEAWGERLPAWSPVSDRLAFVERDDTMPGVQSGAVHLRILDLSSGKPVLTDLLVPEAFRAQFASNQSVQVIRGVAWISDETILVSFFAIDYDQPGQLFQVNLSSGQWSLVAQYYRTTGREPPGELAASENGQFVAWAGNDLVVLNTTTWHEYTRLQVAWLGAALLHWVQDSNNLPVLIYSTNNQFWSYRLTIGATSVLLPGPVLARDAGLNLVDSDWIP